MKPIEVAGLIVHSEVVSHPLLGDAQVIEHAGAPITALSAIDWERPTRIPTVAEPGRLPRGSGSMLLNEIARRAQTAQVTSLRYAGPYPTPALYRTLLRSFRSSGSEDEFAAHVLDRALSLARDEVPVDFKPAPFRRIATPHGYVDVRDGIERAQLDGVLFDREGAPGSLARLREHAAELAFANVAWVRIAKLDERGAIVEGPHPIPALTGEMIGKTFSAALCIQLGELVAELVPPPLAEDARRLVAERPIAWADLGWRACARQGNGFAVHLGFWLQLAPHGVSRFALALAEALAHVVTMTILDELPRV